MLAFFPSIVEDLMLSLGRPLCPCYPSSSSLPSSLVRDSLDATWLDLFLEVVVSWTLVWSC